jgi:hypothetical protein
MEADLAWTPAQCMNERMNDTNGQAADAQAHLKRPINLRFVCYLLVRDLHEGPTNQAQHTQVAR